MAAITTIAATEGLIAQASGDEPAYHVPVEDVGLAGDVLEEPDVNAFRALFTARLRRKAVQIDYVAKAGRRVMIFSPNALVRTSFRLHFRGYCEMRDGRAGIYSDIIPGRVVHADLLGRSDYVDAAGDAEWNKMLHIVATLRPDLPESIAEALRREHGLCQYDLRTKPIRAAVAPYVVEAFAARRVRGWDGPVWQAHVEMITNEDRRRTRP